MRILITGLLCVYLGPATSAGAPAQVPPSLEDNHLLPNGQFDRGENQPEGWTLSGGAGRWVDRQWLEVTGTGSDSNYWRSVPIRLEPGRLYRFAMQARRTSGNGCVVAGPSMVNRDYHEVDRNWKWYSHVFRVPDGVESDYIRLGQWQAPGTVQFNAASLRPVFAVHRQIDSATAALQLGEGESVVEDTYAFAGSFAHLGSNYHRPLLRSTAAFNSNRWVFVGASEVIYRFALPGCGFVKARVEANINWHARGGCQVEVSSDGRQWHTIGAQDGVGSVAGEAPAAILPASELLVRLRPTSDNSAFQVDRVEFQGKLDRRLPEASGQTVFADVLRSSEPVRLVGACLTGEPSSGSPVLALRLHNAGDRPTDVACVLERVAEPAGPPLEPAAVSIAAGNEQVLRVPLPAWGPGDHRFRLTLAPSASPADSSQLELTVAVPELYRADYGSRIAGVSGPAVVWWCEAGWKIARQRPVPQAACQAALLQAARNDFEAVQVVLRPERALRGVRAEAGPLTGPGGASIAAENVRILRVYYHFVHHPTDSTGVRDWWPDALPPLDDRMDLAAGLNQPLWVLVYVPHDAPAGDYTGQLRLEAEGWSAVVPLRLHVWDFALPERNHLETAFGFSPSNVFRYHQLRTDEQKRIVLDMYWQCFSEHRISPYDPTPLDRIGVQFLPDADPPRAELDFGAFDREMSRVIRQFRFTNFHLPVQGMGGGSFHARYEPQIAGHGEDSPKYQAMFSSYVKQLEDHLREKGWLPMAYVYWFDEPAPRDYQFVTNGMERLARYAPGLQRMLTEEPSDELKAPVDIWCPVTPNYDHSKAESRRALGERFWWYVCTGPKAPYCTLFIDHPATELRVWLWQTWQRNIAGILVWEATYWTSTAAFPDAPQNPYEDPMGYVSGYSTPKGTRRFWGNGDGRFIYPPLSAAVPGASGSAPVLQPPVSSIRWEMLREGIEDWEMLYLLRQLIEKQRNALLAEQAARLAQLLEVPPEITRDMTTFTTDPRPIHQRRAAIAEAIEHLLRAP